MGQQYNCTEFACVWYRTSSFLPISKYYHYLFTYCETTINMLDQSDSLHTIKDLFTFQMEITFNTPIVLRKLHCDNITNTTEFLILFMKTKQAVPLSTLNLFFQLLYFTNCFWQSVNALSASHFQIRSFMTNYWKTHWDIMNSQRLGLSCV